MTRRTFHYEGIQPSYADPGRSKHDALRRCIEQAKRDGVEAYCYQEPYRALWIVSVEEPAGMEWWYEAEPNGDLFLVEME